MHDTFWLCLETMAASVDGSRAEEEEALDELEVELRQLPARQRDRISQEMRLIVSQLSRLVVRLNEVSEPIAPA